MENAAQDSSRPPPGKARPLATAAARDRAVRSKRPRRGATTPVRSDSYNAAQHTACEHEIVEEEHTAGGGGVSQPPEPPHSCAVAGTSRLRCHARAPPQARPQNGLRPSGGGARAPTCSGARAGVHASTPAAAAPGGSGAAARRESAGGEAAARRGRTR
eukprot:661703-Prymnesium_polylepis.1